MTSDSRPRRGRGRPPRIDRERIVQAAIEVGLDSLTMRSVAERLGVHPSALNYHVSSREELVEVVASAVLDLNIDGSWTPPVEAPWQDWVRAFARELRRVLLEHTSITLYFRFRPGPGFGGLDQFDRFLGVLLAAGFDDASVAVATHYISQVVFMSVRDELMARGTGAHPQDEELRRAAAQAADGELDNVRRLLAAGGHGDPNAQFDFNLECVIAGLEHQLSRSKH